MIGRKLPIGDLDVSTGTFQRLTGPQYAAQKIRQRLLFILGEWVLDIRLGQPWFEEILVKNPNMKLVQQRVRDCILGVPGITNVRQVEILWDRVNRNLSLAYVADYQGTSEPIADVLVSGVGA